MITKTIKLFLILTALTLLLTPEAWTGNKKIMTTRASKVLAERALVESIYGLKVRASEEVQDMIAANFTGKTETKTSARIS